jgi:hypothetical protein
MTQQFFGAKFLHFRHFSVFSAFDPVSLKIAFKKIDDKLCRIVRPCAEER